MKLPAAHAAQAPALRELQGILAKANNEGNLRTSEHTCRSPLL